MLELSNIKINGSIISAMVKTVEAKEVIFKLTVDYLAEEIILNSLGYMNCFVAHAKYKMLELGHMDEEDIPEVVVIAWY